MALKLLDQRALFPAPDRLHVHFAVLAEDGSLLTLKAERMPGERTLTRWRLSAELEPTHHSELSLPQAVYDPGHQLDARRLLLWDDDDLLEIGLSPFRVNSARKLPGLQAAVPVGDVLWAVCEGGLFRLKGRASSLVLPSPERWGSGRYVARLGDRLCWATQDALQLLDTAPPAAGARLPLDGVMTFPLALSATRAVVFEVYDDEHRALTFLEVGAKLKKSSVHYPKHRVLAWARAGGRLFVVLMPAKERKDGTRPQVLAVFDEASGTELSSSELPFAVGEDQETTRVVWCGARKGTLAVLLGDGRFARFRFPQAR